jgi:nitroimidazol reductase NimA-like FMN-containing flavoprotein (pyridoxamine 5'-phosphate oxidase superfamily)
MLIQRMGTDECAQLLGRVSLGRIGTTRDGQPYVVPVYFAYEPEHIYSFATAGRKIEWMRLNPRVCLQADEILSENKWTSVVVDGRYEEIPDDSEHADWAAKVRSLLGKRYYWWKTGYDVYQVRGQLQPISLVLYCIHIEQMAGLRAIPDEEEKAIAAGYR